MSSSAGTLSVRCQRILTGVTVACLSVRNGSLFEAALSAFLCRCEARLKRPMNSSETFSKAGASETRCTQLD